MSYLKKFYPSLYIFLLEHLNKKEEIELYKKECKALQDDPQNYYLYIFGYLIPLLEG